MDAPLLVLIDGKPEDSALVRAARDYADTNGCPVTLMRVLPEATRAHRTDSGVEILPWQIMHMMEADAKFELEKLRTRYLRGRSLPSMKVVRFGSVVSEVASQVDSDGAQALLARSKKAPILPWLKRDERLKRRLAVPVILMDAADRLIGEPILNPMLVPFNRPDKLQVIRDLPVFAGLPRKKLESVAQHLDETRVAAGTTLVHEGHRNHAFWIVVEGELVRTSRGRLLDRITPPSLVGLPSMLDGESAWATVTTATPVRALVASTEQFRVLAADEGVALRLWEQAGARLRQHILGSLDAAG
jgi:nucleotide-binding universal stress UspA family protein